MKIPIYGDFLINTLLLSLVVTIKTDNYEKNHFISSSLYDYFPN